MIHEKDCWSDPLSSSAGEGGYHLKAAPVAGSSTYELDACPVRPGRMKFHMDFEREYKTLDRSHLQSLSFTPSSYLLPGNTTSNDASNSTSVCIFAHNISSNGADCYVLHRESQAIRRRSTCLFLVKKGG
jgi:hypothetical protein